MHHSPQGVAGSKQRHFDFVKAFKRNISESHIGIVEIHRFAIDSEAPLVGVRSVIGNEIDIVVNIISTICTEELCGIFIRDRGTIKHQHDRIRIRIVSQHAHRKQRDAKAECQEKGKCFFQIHQTFLLESENRYYASGGVSCPRSELTFILSFPF